MPAQTHIFSLLWDVFKQLDGTLLSCAPFVEEHAAAYKLSHSQNSCLRTCSLESTILVWTGLFLAGLDGALVLFQSYWLRLEHHNYVVSSEYAESFSRSMHPTHGCTKGDGMYDGSLQLAEMLSLLSPQCHLSESIGSFFPPPCNYSVANVQNTVLNAASLSCKQTGKA